MDAARWDDLEVLFEETLALPPGERAAFLAASCRDDAALRAELESLLAAHDTAPAYFERLAEALPLLPPPAPHDHALVADPYRRLGQIVAHYQVESLLGSGGMGVVYRAHDLRLGRPVALKFLPLHLSTREARQRFVAEAKAASALDHPNICTIHEIGEAEDGQLFIAMPCYEGRTLTDAMAQGPLPLQDALDYACQLAEGLSAAHGAGIVHRDVKPANVLITAKGLVKILDFGIAKVAGAGMTKTGAILGTVAYMSPEQISGGALDHRTDLWSLGVVLYEMLAGRRPFQGAYEQAVVHAIQHEAPPPLTTYHPEVPAALDRVVSTCLAKVPSDRYPSAGALLDDLQALRDGFGSAAARRAPAKRLAAFVVPPRGRRVALGLAGIVLTALLLWLLPGSQHLFTQATPVPAKKQLAVLPFTNIGGDPAQQALSDGLTETLTSKLAQLEPFQEAFWVIPASEVRAQALTSVREARRTLGVNLAVTGSIQQDAGLVRLTLSLVDAASLRQLASVIITEPLTNIAALQDDVVLELARMLELEAPPQARRVLARGGTAVPDAYAFYLQGRGYLQRYEAASNLDHAIRLFEQALEEDSAYALAHAGLGEAYWRKYEAAREPALVDRAMMHCERAARLNDRLSPVHETLGLIYAGTGRNEEAVHAFRRALALNPASAAAHRGLARAYEEQGRLGAAEAAYREAIRLRPGYWAGYNELGVFYYLHGRYEEAVAQFRQVVALTPDNTRGYNNLGALLFSLERYEEAREAFEESLRLAASYSAYSNLGTVYFYQARYEEAAAMYQEALRIDEHDYRVWGNLGAAYYWTPGQRLKAERAYEQAVRRAEAQRRVNPLDPELLCDLANYHGMLGRREEALLLLKQALALAPDNTEVMFGAASTYEHLGEREQALHWIEQALEHGYSQAKIEHSPGLEQLRVDPRFEALLAARPSPSPSEAN